MEIWKRIEVDCVNKYYEVSNMGNVRSVLKTDSTKIKNLSKIDTGKGYERVAIKTKTALIHRLVAQSFLPNPNNKPQVNHIDGNKKNNNASNLEWSTNIENINHARKTGLNKIKITEEEFRYIKNSYNEDNSLDNLIRMSKKFNVSIDYLKKILKDGLITFSKNSRKQELSDSEIKYIYENTIKNDENFNIGQMSKKFNVSVSVVSRILNDISYTDITKNLNKNLDNYKEIKKEKKQRNRMLNNEDIRYIYENTVVGRTEFNVTKMAEKFSVSKQTISRIVNDDAFVDITKDLVKHDSNRKTRVNKKRTLDDEMVKYIYENTIINSDDFSPSKMAEEFNVSKQIIFGIINDRYYKNTTKNLKRNEQIIIKGKLSLEDIKYIYENTNYNNKNHNITSMSIKYGVSVTDISEIVNNKKYTNVTKDLIRKKEYEKII